MVTDEVVNYVKEAKATGRPADEIKKALVGAGWKEADVDEAVAKAEGVPAASQAPVVVPSPIVSAPASGGVTPSWGTVGAGSAEGVGEVITLPKIETEKVVPKVSMQEMPPAASVMASVQPSDAGGQPTTPMRVVRSGGTLPKKLILLIVLAVLLVAGGVGIFAAYQNFFNNPLRIVGSAVEKLVASDSFTMTVDVAPSKQLGTFSGTVNFVRTGAKLSKADLKVAGIAGDAGKTVNVTAIFGSSDILFRPGYSEEAELENWMKTIYPKLTELRTYQTAKPVLGGDSWFEAKLPIGEMSWESGKTVLGVESGQDSILQDKLMKSLVVRKLETTDVGGHSYYKVVLGFNKVGLLDLLASLQPTQVVVDLRKAINTTNGLNADLVEILVDKGTGNLTSLMVSVPGDIRGAVASGLSGVRAGGLPLATVTNYLPNQVGGQPVYGGRVTFSNFNQTVGEAKPISTVDLGLWLAAAKVEVPPILGGYLTRGRLPEPFAINIAEAQRLWETGDYRAALTQAGNMIGMAETNIEKAAVHYWIGAASYKLGDLMTAATEEQSATLLDSQSGVPYAVLALIAINNKDLQTAYSDAVKAVALDSSSPWTHNSLGLVLLALNRRPEAVVELKKAVVLASGSAEIQANLAEAEASPSPTPLPLVTPRGSGTASAQVAASPSATPLASP